MSDKVEPEVAEKKKGGLGKKLGIGLVLITILGGGGAAGGYFLAGQINTDAHAAVDPDMPKLVSKDGSEVAAPVSNEKQKSQEKSGLSNLKATYYPIETPFTSNLKDSSSFAQMSLAVATYYDERVLENIQAHETAIRSSVLMTMAEQDSAVLSTQQGKETLQGLLTTAINNVLEEKTGFGGVDNVYFTSFVVQ